LETSQHAEKTPVYKEGNRYQTGFTYDGTVSFCYEAGSLSVEKQIALVQGENTVVVAYRIKNTGAVAEFCITPLMNFREHSTSSTPETLQFSNVPMTGGKEGNACGFVLTPAGWEEKLSISLAASTGTLRTRSAHFDVDMQLQTEVDNEVEGLDCHYTPYDIVFAVPEKETIEVSLVCSVSGAGVDPETGIAGEDSAAEFAGMDSAGTLAPDFAFSAIRRQKAYLDRLVEKAGYGNDDFANTLVLAANQFLTYRKSTGLRTVLAGLPWFTDWGRDTMIAFTGLTLATGRYDAAREILLTFSKYVRHGMVPNMFPDNGMEPLYNTADASLWYFYAVYQYLRYVGTDEAYDFIRREIYPSLKEIFQAYRTGTDFSIYMDTDGLIHAGSGLDQVTWMDVRVGDWVVTPRHGKPVEINALWYNALCIMEELSARFGEDPDVYRTLAAQVKDSFCRRFWNAEKRYLYDVIDECEDVGNSNGESGNAGRGNGESGNVAGGIKDDARLRPNQIYAVSLPFSLLSEEQARSVVAIVQEKLYAGCGLRSLSPDDPEYHPIYLGALPKRDAAYHQGTAWGFLMGAFISAYTKVHHHSPEAIRQALAFLAPVEKHFTEGCIGSISEIFDGDAPHTCRGCYAQAWSVGEVLRCYREDILPYR
jgi:glycogen debranching enzyme